MENNKKFKHLDYVQSVISRMASNSFLLKGWAVTLVAGIFALANKEANKMYFLLAYAPTFLFWFLDTYYLYQERLYREKYNEIRKMREEDIDLDMNVDQDKYKVGKNHYINCLMSITEWTFYVGLMLVVAVIIHLTTK